MHKVKSTNFLQYVLINHSGKKNYSDVISEQEDSAAILETSRAFKKLELFLDLNKPDKLDLSDLNDIEKDEFLEMLAELLKCGVVGYEIKKVNGKPEKHYIIEELRFELMD